METIECEACHKTLEHGEEAIYAQSGPVVVEDEYTTPCIDMFDSPDTGMYLCSECWDKMLRAVGAIGGK